VESHAVSNPTNTKEQQLQIQVDGLIYPPTGIETTYRTSGLEDQFASNLVKKSAVAPTCIKQTQSKSEHKRNRTGTSTAGKKGVIRTIFPKLLAPRQAHTRCCQEILETYHLAAAERRSESDDEVLDFTSIPRSNIPRRSRKEASERSWISHHLARNQPAAAE
jgi:hypothetical protein